MSRSIASFPARLLPLVLALSLGGCSTVSDLFSGDKVDYKTPTARQRPLEVPPDLTQISRENRYPTQGGVVSASGIGNAPAAAAPGGPAVAPLSIGDVRVEREGNERWLLVRKPPEQLWQPVKDFWLERGFTLASENADSGVMETDWQMDRAKLPQDAIRSTLGRVFGNLYDTGERDRFITRIERTAGGSEIYIRHRGLTEVYLDQTKAQTEWRNRPSDPNLEAEMLSLLMSKLGVKPEVAKTVVAQAPQAPARARALAGSGAALEVDEPFERAWRRVGLALDRGGFTVEDRDRNGGLYYVRYIDPKNAGKEEPGFFARLFGATSGDKGPQRYRIALKGAGDKTTVSVLTSAGAADVGDNGQRIVTQLVNELR